MASKKTRTESRVPPASAPPSAPPAAPSPAAARPAHWLAAAVLCAITLLAYSNSFTGGDTLDNNQLLHADPRIQNATAANVDQILHHTYWWPYGESGLYRPLATLSYLFNYAVLGNGTNLAGYHAINLALHLLNVLLVYLLGLRLFGERWRAFALAALWSLHPVLTESVTNVVGRPDLLAGFGSLAAFLLYLRATESQGAPRALALCGTAVAIAVGAFSKESAVTVVAVVALYEFLWREERRAAKGRIAACVALAVPIAIMLYQRAQVLAASPAAQFPFLDNPIVRADFLQGRLTALAILARYFWRLLCPITLAADYSYSQIPLATGTPLEWFCWLVVVALAFAVFWLYRRHRLAFFFAVFAAIAILPMSNLVFPIGTIMAERFLYLPAIAFCGCLVLCYDAVPPRVRAAAPVVAVLLVVAYGVRTWLRNPDWRSDFDMARSLVKVSPNSYKVRKMLAFHLFQSDPTHANIDQVIAHADRGLEILEAVPNADNHPEAFRFAGGYYHMKGDGLRHRDAAGNLVTPPEAIQAYQHGAALVNRAIAMMGWADQPPARFENSPPDKSAGDAFRVLSIIYSRLNDTARAYDAGLRAQQIDPLNPEMYLNLSRVLVQAGHSDGAAVALLEGSVLTRDKRIGGELLKLFQGDLDTAHCALRPASGGMTLNPACETVRRYMCPAMDAAMRIRYRLGQSDIARSIAAAAVQDYGCPATPVNQMH